MLTTIRRGGLLTGALAVLVLAGCSTPEAGNPTVATGANSSSPTAAPSSAQSGGSNELASVEACSLFTDQEAAKFKIEGPGKADNEPASGATSTCGWTGRSANDSSTSFGVLVRATQGLADVNKANGTATDGNVNGRPAVQFTSNVGAKCLIALGVTAQSRVDISYVIGAGQDSTEACQSASDIASVVEPRLPKYRG
ncbi:MAG TPA: DUF3558 domain-containing protein [Amycolatopsis sp.]|nr:DUF3558 domain-containing protein [Amycolatopsis sp.]